VIFICQAQQQRQTFMHAADHELTGHRAAHNSTDDAPSYPGRSNILFVTELDMHKGDLEAARLPPHPPGHPKRQASNSRVRRIQLPAARADSPNVESPAADVAA